MKRAMCCGTTMTWWRSGCLRWGWDDWWRLRVSLFCRVATRRKAMMRLWLLMVFVASALDASGFEPTFAPDFAPIKVYEGRWTVVSAHTMAGDGKPDTIANHCTEGTAFYTCEQVVNGKSLALLVFTATDDPAKFHTQPVLPSGLAAGRGDLTIAGDHWTFLGSG